MVIVLQGTVGRGRRQSMMNKVKSAAGTHGLLPQDCSEKASLGQILGRRGEVCLSDIWAECCCLKEQPHNNFSGGSREK